MALPSCRLWLCSICRGTQEGSIELPRIKPQWKLLSSVVICMCCILNVLLSIFLLNLYLSPLNWNFLGIAVVLIAVELWSYSSLNVKAEGVKMGFLLVAAIFLVLISIESELHLWILFVLVSIVYCGCFGNFWNFGIKTFHVGRIFHVARIFFSSCVFLRVLQDLNWMFFTDSTKHFSHTCSDKTEGKRFIFLGDLPYCSLHLSTLLVTRTLVLSCIVILQCLGEVVEGIWSEGAYGASTNTLHPW